MARAMPWRSPRSRPRCSGPVPHLGAGRRRPGRVPERLGRARRPRQPPDRGSPPRPPVARVAGEPGARLRHVLRHPTPKYPLAARKEHLTGEGSFFLEIDTISGAVTHVTVSKSTGHAILDQAAIFALRQWRFAPHSAVEVSVPITFSMDSRSPTPTGKH